MPFFAHYLFEKAFFIILFCFMFTFLLLLLRFRYIAVLSDKNFSSSHYQMLYKGWFSSTAAIHYSLLSSNIREKTLITLILDG